MTPNAAIELLFLDPAFKAAASTQAIHRALNSFPLAAPQPVDINDGCYLRYYLHMELQALTTDFIQPLQQLVRSTPLIGFYLAYQSPFSIGAFQWYKHLPHKLKLSSTDHETMVPIETLIPTAMSALMDTHHPAVYPFNPLNDPNIIIIAS